MAAWIYLFSKFTSEALLLEALCILFLLGGYASFWILKKRRFGAIRISDVPAPVVKAYLNQLISDAHQMRVQLFGLLSAAGAISPAESAPLNLKLTAASDPGLQAKLDALEHKMSDQMISYEKILGEKEQIEQELARMRAGQPATGSDGSPAAGGSDELPKLKDKIATLEARLAEYSVIEDDLANLKRLQQENAQLRSQLGTGSGAKPSDPSLAAAPGLASAPAEPKAAEGPREPSLVASAPSTQAEPQGPVAGELHAEPELKSAARAAAEAISAAQPDAAAATAAPGQAQAEAEGQGTKSTQASENPGFENLVDHVEKSLADSPEAGKNPTSPAAAKSAQVAQTATPGGNAETPSVSTTAIPKANVEKSDEDLIAEFEKMLSS